MKKNILSAKNITLIVVIVLVVAFITTKVVHNNIVKAEENTEINQVNLLQKHKEANKEFYQDLVFEILKFGQKYDLETFSLKLDISLDKKIDFLNMNDSDYYGFALLIYNLYYQSDRNDEKLKELEQVNKELLSAASKLGVEQAYDFKLDFITIEEDNK